jgi:hypothetical protein
MDKNKHGMRLFCGAVIMNIDYDEKYCPACKTVRYKSKFTPNKMSSDGYTSYCRDCNEKLNKTKWWNGSSKAKNRKRYIDYCKIENPHPKYKKNNGIADDFNENVNKYGKGTCFICGKKTEKMCLDHDHNTGKARGYLCQQCNSGIGFLRDDKELLIKAALYLHNSKQK